MRRWLIAAIALACAPLLHGAPVKVAQGQLEGTDESGMRVFRGIPFAAPPVGTLRWREPQPVASWPGVRKADQFGPACAQGRVEADGSLASGISEDCLYLNVWTPAKAGEKLPVLVWIYGGGFSGGRTSDPMFDGAALASKGVVYVSVAYRVGVIGFFAHPELSAENKRAHGVAASGNYGLLDMVSSLQWIKKNIAAFGGDPNKVTIWGESAGAMAVSMLTVAPQAKGLFRGAISDSGGSFGAVRTPTAPGENLPPLAIAEQAGVALANKVHAPGIEALRGKSAGELMTQSRGIGGIGWPVLDQWVLPDDQHVLYEKGKYHDTPILVGINSDEGASFSRTSDRAQFESDTRVRFGPLADRILKAYPADASGSIKQAARDVMREASFGWHTWVWAKLQNARGGSPAYVYYMDQRPPYPADSRNADVAGVPHGQELPYVFQKLDLTPLPWTDADRRVSAAMATYWTNFAKTGNPNGGGLPQWPAFTVKDQQRMEFKGTPQSRPYDNVAQLEAMDAYFAWRRTPEGHEFGKHGGDTNSAPLGLR
ncbi:MAG TPA: carboxylesterase family protein [Steroidobacteraceae bacterium]|nr:carboxylesterase family protein [Steroidobacteraceae bacterium]